MRTSPARGELDRRTSLFQHHAKAVTPIPGGVGPIVVTCLLSQIVAAARSLATGSTPDRDPPRRLGAGARILLSRRHGVS
ncbi:MAG: hypothetical protein JHD35_03000 [Sphingopyxis sp.]|nr:hypothetical protein [Sphingopyxis sp.]